MAAIALLTVSTLLLAHTSHGFIAPRGQKNLIPPFITTTSTASTASTTLTTSTTLTPLTTLLSSTAPPDDTDTTTIAGTNSSNNNNNNSNNNKKARPVQKVAIIGGGIAGLTAAHALKSKLLTSTSTPTTTQIEVDIFDSRSGFDENSGSGIQVTGGLVALENISPSLRKKVTEAGLPLKQVLSRCRPWFGGRGGIGDENQAGGVVEGWKILELDIPNAIREKAEAINNKRKAEMAEKLEQSLEGEGNNDSDADSNDDLEKENFGLLTKEGEVLAYTILRGTLQRILYEELVQEYGLEVHFDKRLTGISYWANTDSGEDSEGIICTFQDGETSGPYDIVIGCDGVKSFVKEYVDSGTTVKKLDNPPSSSSSSSSAIYSGIRITFAVQEGAKEEEIKTDGAYFTQFFGNGAYALTTSYGAGKDKPIARGAFLVYGDENYIGPFPKSMFESEGQKQVQVQLSNDVVETPTLSETKSEEQQQQPTPLEENADWTQNNQVPKQYITEVMDVLKAAEMPGNAVVEIVQNADRFFDLGVYFHNPFSWNGWIREVPTSSNGGVGGGKEKSGKFCVLAGDAAHAMPPFLGQGANQAMQDACMLATKIHEYNEQIQNHHLLVSGVGNDDNPVIDEPNLKSLLKEYENKRWLPTTSITAKAALLGYLEIGSGFFAKFRDSFFFVMGKIGVAKKIFLDAATPKM